MMLVLYMFHYQGILQQRISLDILMNEGRLDIWQFALDMFKISPFFGFGARSTFAYGVSTEGVIFGETIAWHNTWIAILIENGILGLSSYCLIMVSVGNILKNGLMAWLKNPNKISIYVAILSIIAFRYFIMSMTEMNLYTVLRPGVMLIFSALGIFIIYPEYRTSEKRNNNLNNLPIGRAKNRH